MNTRQNVSLLDDTLRITISDLPPRPTQPTEEELAQVFGGFVGNVDEFFRDKIFNLIKSLVMHYVQRTNLH